MSKLVLIDGHSILNRAFFGVPELTNSEGLHTNAIYGFLNIMFKILDEESPDYLTVAFDVSAPTFRHEMYKEYKGTRKPMDDALREQVPVMKDVLRAMGIKVIEAPGFEADDLLGTLAFKAQKEGIDVSLVSGDRDLLQIATEKIKIRIPKTKGGSTTIEDYYAADVLKSYGVTPKQFIELKALMGDSADNIPGVPKVGQKTATELMTAYHSLDNIYENIESITKNSIRESLKDNRDLAYLSKTLATIKTDVELDYSFEDARVGNFYTDDAYVIFKRLEFRNYLGRFETRIDNRSVTASFKLVDDPESAGDIVSSAVSCGSRVGLCLLFDDKNTDELLGFALSFDDKSYFIKKWMLISDDSIINMLGKILSSCDVVSDNAKLLYRFTDRDIHENIFDVIIAAYLLNPVKNDYDLTAVGQEYLGLITPDISQVKKKTSLSDAILNNTDLFREYACFRSYICLRSYDILTERLKQAGMYDLFMNIEMPLSYVLFNMEQDGIRAVPEKLNDYSQMLGSNIVSLESEIYKEAGCEFNINSPKQLGEILFEKLKLPGGKKTKTGYSTAADVLEKLAAQHPIVKKILDYRAYTKLKSTYADGLQNCIGPDGRIHSTFNQTITATGRLSSTDPNLQNIPIRMDLGRQIRKVFVPKDGCVFMDADYSQIELRVLASLSGDSELIKAYSEHADIHRSTASLVFNVPYDEVTDAMRRNAKAVNFGIVYGISAFGLGEDLGISQKEAKKYIEDYFKTYPAVKNFLDDMVSSAKDKGYAITYYGRRRPIPELKSSNFMQRSFGERVAMNSPIQGTAADIIKIAMINVFNALKEANLRTRLILQVHDELLLEVPCDELDKAEKILRDQMIGACDLAVNMEVDLHTGNDWYEAK